MSKQVPKPPRLTAWLMASGSDLIITAKHKPASISEYGGPIKPSDVISISGTDWGSDISIHLDRAQTIQLAAALAALLAEEKS
jgi:hypothetical protein